MVFSLSDVPAIKQFVAREDKLLKIHRILKCDDSCCIVILYGLGRISKMQISIVYVKWHKDDYSVIFWLNIKDEDSVK